MSVITANQLIAGLGSRAFPRGGLYLKRLGYRALLQPLNGCCERLVSHEVNDAHSSARIDRAGCGESARSEGPLVGGDTFGHTDGELINEHQKVKSVCDSPIGVSADLSAWQPRSPGNVTATPSRSHTPRRPEPGFCAIASLTSPPHDRQETRVSTEVCSHSRTKNGNHD